MTSINGTSGANGYYNPQAYQMPSSYNHIGGLATGLDTDSMIQQLMMVAKIPLNSLLQQRQLLQWKQQDYLKVNSSLQDLHTKLSSMRLQSTYLRKTTTSSDSSVVTATASPTAGNLTYSIKVSRLATSGVAISDSGLTKTGQTFDPNKPLVDPINGQQGNLAGGDALPTGPFTITINGESISVDPTRDSLNTIIGRINADPKTGVSMYYDANADRISMTTTSTGKNADITVDSGSWDFFSKVLHLGTFTNPLQSDGQPTINADKVLNDSSNIWAPNIAVPSSAFTFTLNGQSFTVDPSSDTLQSILDKINAKQNQTGVIASYDSNSGRITLTSTNYSLFSPQIQITETDSEGFISKLFASSTSSVRGTDAQYTLNGLQTSSASNTFTVNGVTFNLKAANPNETVQVSVGTDTDTVYKAISDFIDQYNKTYQTMNDLYNEKRDYDYPPLTDDQKAQMTQTQIDEWNQQAMKGMLGGDTLLGSAIDQMVNSATGLVSGLTGTFTYPGSNGVPQTITINSLASIGITTDSFVDGNGNLVINSEPGMLHISDPDKLRAAISQNPQAVMQLFTQNSAQLGAVNNTQGIAVQLYNAVNNAMNSIYQQAGYGDTQFDNSFLGQEIADINNQAYDLQQSLNDKYNQYVQMFSDLESAIGQLNAQSQMLQSQLGSLPA
jgi:flagellar hook-associated protein 2